MLKKKWSFAAIGLSATLVLGACGNGEPDVNAADQEYDLKMSVSVSESSTWYEAAEKLKEDLAEESDGRINLEIYTNEQLSGGDSGKAVEGLAKGTIDLTFNSTIIYSILDDRFGVTSAPFLFNNTEEVDSVFASEGGEMIKEILTEKGIHTLGYGENGFRQLTNSKLEVKSPEDLKGLKIRIPGTTVYTDLYRELGTDPQTMTFSEVFTALQQGTIDGQENAIDVIYSSKLNEVQDYMTMWNYSYDPLVLGMNKKLYDSLSDEDKELFDRLGKEAAAYQVEIACEKEVEQITALEEAGMSLYYPSDEELAQFKEAVQPIYDKYTDIWGADLLSAFQGE